MVRVKTSVKVNVKVNVKVTTEVRVNSGGKDTAAARPPAQGSVPASVTQEPTSNGKDAFDSGNPRREARYVEQRESHFQGPSGSVHHTFSPDLNTDLRNVAAPSQFEQGWAQSTPTVQQQASDTCGPAAVAMLVGSKNPAKVKDRAQYMQALEARTSDGRPGTTPQEMARMLASEGLEVTRGVAELDKRAVTEALAQGQKVLILMDSSGLLPQGGTGAPGTAHWAVVDGFDARGNYLVRDPASGKSSYLPPAQLARAVATSQQVHGSGGLLVVQDAKGASAARLEARNLEQSAVLGTGPGTGSPGVSGSREAGN
jgi:predicted double-glycine peptidase